MDNEQSETMNKVKKEINPNNPDKFGTLIKKKAIYQRNQVFLKIANGFFLIGFLLSNINFGIFLANKFEIKDLSTIGNIIWVFIAFGFVFFIPTIVKFLKEKF